MNISIEPIREDHIQGFHSALDSVARERRYLAFTEAPTIETTAAFVRANITRGVPQVVALDGQQVVGWCDICPRSGQAVFRHVGVLGMGIIADYRSKGIGRSMLELALARAMLLGLERIELEVYESNQRAIALYERMGFEREGMKRRYARFDDRYENGVVMALIFKDGQ